MLRQNFPACGRSFIFAIAFREKQVSPGRFSSALPVCMPLAYRQKFALEPQGSSLLPPPCRAFDSQQKSGRISVLHPPRTGGVSTPGRARRRKTAYLRRAKKCDPVFSRREAPRLRPEICPAASFPGFSWISCSFSELSTTQAGRC